MKCKDCKSYKDCLKATKHGEICKDFEQKFYKPKTKMVVLCMNCKQRLDSNNYRRCPNCKSESYFYEYPITYFETENGVKVVN